MRRRFPPSILRNEHGGARLIGTGAGLIIGGVVAGLLSPATFGSSAFLYAVAAGASVGATAGGLAGGLYETANLDDTINKQETIADLRIQTSTLGQTIPQVFGGKEGGAEGVPGGGGGGGRLAGNVIWASEKQVLEHRETQQSRGGKGGGGGPKTINITKTYTISMALALCDTRVSGPMTLILRAWKNANLWYDVNQFTASGFLFPTNWTLYTGTADQLPDPTMEAALGVGNVPGYRYLCYLVMQDEDLGAFGQVPQWSFELGQTGETLTTVVTKLCDAAMLIGEDIDLTALPAGDVQMTLTSIEAVRAPLEQLALVYRFYGLESGLKYVFRQVGVGDVVATIPEDDLSAGENQADERGPQLTRITNLELPTTFYVTYIDPAQNYQRNTQPSTVVLPSSGRENPKNLSLPLSISGLQARQLANELMVQAWVQRESFQGMLSRKYAYLEPGDKIEATTRGLTYSLLLPETTYGDPGLVEIIGRVNASPRAGVIVPGVIMPTDTAITGAPTAPPGVATPMDQVTAAIGDTTPLLLNLPVLSSTDQAPRYHVAYVGATEPWEGGTLYRSVDGSASFQALDAGSLEGYTGAVALAVATVADWTVLDTVTVFQVVLEYGTLTTINDTANAAGLQRVMVGSEMIYVGIATLVTGRTYDCSRLWRGRQGTEYAVATHGVDEVCVLIDTAVHSITMTLAERGVSFPFKAVTNGQLIADATPVTFAATAENLRPWQVLPPLASRPAQDWQIRWYMRSRFIEGGFDPDFVGFEVKIYSSATFLTVVRTITTSGGYAMDPVVLKGVNYTAAQQVLDHGSVQSTLYFTVAQVGAYATGRVTNQTSTDVTTVQGAIEDTAVMPSFIWVEVTAATQAMAVATGYVANRAQTTVPLDNPVIFTLPATAAIGDAVEVVGRGTGGWRVNQAASQQIRFGVMQSLVGTSGWIAAGNPFDSVTLRCVEADVGWVVDAFQGLVTVH